MVSEYDPLTNPMTYEEYRNYILLKLQAQGINPFIELDLNDIPSNGTAWNSIFNHRKIYGDMVTGFYVSGPQFDSNGQLKYENSIQTSINSQLSTQVTATNRIMQTVRVMDNPDNYAPTAATPTTLTDYSVHWTDITLSSGSGTSAIYAPGSGKKAYVHAMMFGCNNTTNPQTSYYQLDLTEETSGNRLGPSYTLTQTNAMGRWLPFYDATGTADKDVDVAISGGQAGEVVRVGIVCGKF